MKNEENECENNSLVSNYLQSKDEKFLKLLFKNNARSLYVFISYKVNEKVEIEEVVQETLIRAWKNLSKYDQTKKFKNWLFVIANNIIIDRWRIKNDVEVLNEETVIENDINIEDIIDNNIDTEKVFKILDELKSEQKQVFVMHYLDELSYKEIAEILNLSLNTVKSIGLRAVKYIKDKMHQK